MKCISKKMKKVFICVIGITVFISFSTFAAEGQVASEKTGTFDAENSYYVDAGSNVSTPVTQISAITVSNRQMDVRYYSSHMKTAYIQISIDSTDKLKSADKVELKLYGWLSAGGCYSLYEVADWGNTTDAASWSVGELLGQSTPMTASGNPAAAFDVTSYISTLSDDDNFIRFAVREPIAVSNGLLYAGGSNVPSITLLYDITPPVASNVRITGIPVEGEMLNLSYDYTGFYEEENSEYQWYSDGVKIENETTNQLTLTGDMVGKTITASIKPHSKYGKYSENGEATDEIEVEYSQNFGPILSIIEVNRLVRQIPGLSLTELEQFLRDNTGLFQIDINRLDTLTVDTHKNAVLTEIIASDPQTILELSEVYNKNIDVQRINEASSSEMDGILRDKYLNLDLSFYNQIEDKTVFINSLTGQNFNNYEELKQAFDNAVIVNKFTTSDLEELYVLLLEHMDSFGIQSSTATYSQRIIAAKYMTENSLSSLTSMDELKILISAAFSYAGEMDESGFVERKLFVTDDAYIKTDYSNDKNGINSIQTVSSDGRYYLNSNINSADYCSYAFWKVDLSEFIGDDSLIVQDAICNIYAYTGGSTLPLYLYTTKPFDSKEDFIDRYPKGSNIYFGEELGFADYVVNNGRWGAIGITKYLQSQIAKGEKYAYFVLKFDIPEGRTPVSSAGRVLSSGEFRPYISLSIETLPIVKNCHINGIAASGETLTVDYDYYGCYDEGETDYKWYSSNTANFDDATQIPGATSKEFILTDAQSGKYIFAGIFPKSDKGIIETARESVVSKDLKIISLSSANEILQQINEQASVDDMTVYIAANNSLFDFDINSMLAGITDKTAVIQTIIDDDFSSLGVFAKELIARRAIQQINESLDATDISDVLENAVLGIDLTGYNNLDEEEIKRVEMALYNKSFTNNDLFRKTFYHAVAIEEFADAVLSDVISILERYDFLLDADIASLDINMKQLLGREFITYNPTYALNFEQINNAVNSALAAAQKTKTELENDKTNNNKIGRTGYPLGGGNGSIIDVLLPDNTNPIIDSSESKNVFSDIESVYSWAGKQITSLYKKGIICGDENGKFNPNESITREAFVKMIVEALELKGENKYNYDDVDSSAWYYEYICVATENGIISGIGNNNFGVGQNLSRQDMAVILFNAITLAQTDNKVYFEDDKEIAQYAKEAVQSIVNSGIMRGTGNNRFAPSDSATRAMAAVVIANSLEYRDQ